MRTNLNEELIAYMADAETTESFGRTFWGVSINGSAALSAFGRLPFLEQRKDASH
jgi:hypothetical protein